MTELKKHIVSMQSLLGSVGYHGTRKVFCDFVELAAIAHANVFPQPNAAALEERYRKLIMQYRDNDREVFPRLLAQLIDALTYKARDVLGELYMSLDAGSARLGQFYTPTAISDVLSRLATPNAAELQQIVDEIGFITAHEPAAGAGALVIEQAVQLLEHGINYQQHYHALLMDIDLSAVHMAYLQLSILHVPATVVHGNTLTLEQHSVWYTPAYHMGSFRTKLKRGYALGSLRDSRSQEFGPTCSQNRYVPEPSSSSLISL